MGLTMADITEISYGRLVLMLQAKSHSYEEPKPQVRQATWAEVCAWI